MRTWAVVIAMIVCMNATVVSVAQSKGREWVIETMRFIDRKSSGAIESEDQMGDPYYSQLLKYRTLGMQRRKRDLESGQHPQELPLWNPEANLWEQLATKVVNTSTFCLQSGKSVTDVFTSCLVGVPTPLDTLRNYTFQYSTKLPDGNTISWEISNEACPQETVLLPTGETLCWSSHLSTSYSNINFENLGPNSNQLDRKMIKVRFGNSFPAESCVRFVNCTRSCRNLSKSVPHLSCNSTSDVNSSLVHTKLPSGWFLLCGRMAYTYIPANSTGGPCSVGRLVPNINKPEDQDKQDKRVKRSAHQLDEACESEVTLFSPAEISAAAFLAPGVGVGMSYQTMKRLACALVKNINYTSRALSAIEEELGQLRQATLENRAVIDYLLLRYNHGCEEFQGMCCFNLTDKSEIVEGKIKRIHDLTTGIKGKNSISLG